jgi:hypothetical protein
MSFNGISTKARFLRHSDLAPESAAKALTGISVLTLALPHLEVFGREYAAQKQQAEKAQKQAQERTSPQQTPKRIGRGGGYGIGN